MKATYDPLADAVYIRFTPESEMQDVSTHVFKDWVAVDIGQNGAVVGFEILDASKCLDLDQLRNLDFEEYEYDDPVLVKIIEGKMAVREQRSDYISTQDE